MNLATLLHRSAAGDRGRPALALGTAPWCSYGELARRSAALAGCLRGRFGLGPGERVALAMVNGPAFIEVLYACWHAGLAAVPINAKLHPAEFRYILEHSGARLCFATDTPAEAIAPATADLATPGARNHIGQAGQPSPRRPALLPANAGHVPLAIGLVGLQVQQRRAAGEQAEAIMERRGEEL